MNDEKQSFKIGNVVNLEVYSEFCCDDCDNIVHNHIDCPVCKYDYADTDQYCDLYDERKLKCKKCETVFEKVSDSWYYECSAKIVYLNA